MASFGFWKHVGNELKGLGATLGSLGFLLVRESMGPSWGMPWLGKGSW